MFCDFQSQTIATIPGLRERVEGEAVPLCYCYKRPKVHYTTATCSEPLLLYSYPVITSPGLFTFREFIAFSIAVCTQEVL